MPKITRTYSGAAPGSFFPSVDGRIVQVGFMGAFDTGLASVVEISTRPEAGAATTTDLITGNIGSFNANGDGPTAQTLDVSVPVTITDLIYVHYTGTLGSGGLWTVVIESNA